MEFSFGHLWILYLSFCICVLNLDMIMMVKALGRECNVTQASHCYDYLVHYEGIGFPFYGSNSAELDETCKTMNDSFHCLEQYVNLCKFQEECDKECNQLIADVETFTLNTGVMMVQQALCDGASVMRQAYLDNYFCLEGNANLYASCHNDSQLSQEFMTTIQDPHLGLEARCCFFTWYHDCFTNITHNTCNENATVFISFTLHTLIGHISHAVCGPNPEICSRPPLPTNYNGSIGIIPLDDKHLTDVDNTLDDKPHDVLGVDKSLYDDNHDVEDLDNSLDKETKSLGTHLSYSLRTVCFVICCILVSKHFM